MYNITMKNKTKKFLDKLYEVEDFLLGANACICCGKECDSDNDYRLCSRCLKEIPFTQDKFCLRCGEILTGNYDFCYRCKDCEYDFDYARSVMAYTDKTSPIIMRFKYNGRKNYAKPLAYLLKDYFAKSDLIADALTFVPMPVKREKERGYNQGKELCIKFSELTGVPMIDCLIRIKENVKQADLNAKQRAENIKGSFAVIDKTLVKNKEFLIIDDVMTTGATASECAKTLIKAGAKNVQVLTIAKTPSVEVGNMFDKN